MMSCRNCESFPNCDGCNVNTLIKALENGKFDFDERHNVIIPDVDKESKEKQIPKYKRGDVVEFIVDNKTQKGTIVIVDMYGTFEQGNQSSYDIIVDDWFDSGETMFCKHVVESLVQKKFRVNRELELNKALNKLYADNQRNFIRKE